MLWVFGLIARRSNDAVHAAAQSVTDKLDDGVAEVDNRASGLRLYVLPPMIVEAEHLQAAELVERDGDAAEVGVFTQRSHVRAHRRVGGAGLVSSRAIHPV